MKLYKKRREKLDQAELLPPWYFTAAFSYVNLKC